ncbi:MAG: hypothetical protein WA865_18710 [Spirulinaceae cyanobacterium]
MNLWKILIVFAIAIVIVKFVASFLGRGNVPLLNNVVTVILATFVCFELFQLGKILLASVS